MKTSAFHKALWPTVLIDCIAAQVHTHQSRKLSTCHLWRVISIRHFEAFWSIKAKTPAGWPGFLQRIGVKAPGKTQSG
jgi:hypothetical protein